MNYIKLFKIQDNCCYNINDMFISSQKDGLILKLVKFEFWHVPFFSAFGIKIVKFLEKRPWHFGIILLIRGMLVFFITSEFP